MKRHEQVEVLGVLCLAVEQACVNLNFFVDDGMKQRLAQLSPSDWVPIAIYLELIDVVAAKYVDPAPILEQIGVELSRIWYQFSPDRARIQRGVDFLHFQTSSEGYYSVVRGDPATIGDFTLIALNEQAGTAVVHSTTPFPKDIERGILRGGVGLVKDVTYVDVNNSSDDQTFEIEFH